MRDCLVKGGIDSSRISVRGNGVDTSAIKQKYARRAEVYCRMILADNGRSLPDTTHITVRQMEPEGNLCNGREMDEHLNQDSIKDVRHKHWYFGIEGGSAFCINDFSSFTRDASPGLTAGAIFGYRINAPLSIEMGTSYSKMDLYANNCCRLFWLGEDGNRYLTHVAGMNGYLYSEIYSHLQILQYNLRINLDLLKLKRDSYDRHWSLAISPAIYGVHSSKSIRHHKTMFLGKGTDFQMGTGIGLHLAICHLSRRLHFVQMPFGF